VRGAIQQFALRTFVSANVLAPNLSTLFGAAFLFVCFSYGSINNRRKSS